MGVIVEKYCILRSDGTLICYDKEDKCYYELKKKVVRPTELSDDELLALMDKLATK